MNESDNGIMASDYPNSKTGVPSDWLKNDFWKTPEWINKPNKTTKFNDYYIYSLRARYVELEMDFRAILHNLSNTPEFDISVAYRVIQLLEMAKKSLEPRQVDRLSVISILDLIERSMIWLIPLNMLTERYKMIKHRLSTESPKLLKLIEYNYKDAAIVNEGESLKRLRPILDEIIGEFNREQSRTHISIGLQAKRMQHLQNCSLIFLLIFLCWSPALATVNSEIYKSMGWIVSFSGWGRIWDFTVFCLLISLAFVGAVGGFISGLLQIRGSRVTLSEYQDSIQHFYLKPLIGAVSAILLSIFLLWNVLPGIKIINLGTLILLVFISGFSERYFFNALQLQEDSDQSPVLSIKPAVPRK